MSCGPLNVTVGALCLPVTGSVGVHRKRSGFDLPRILIHDGEFQRHCRIGRLQARHVESQFYLLILRESADVRSGGIAGQGDVRIGDRLFLGARRGSAHEEKQRGEGESASEGASTGQPADERERCLLSDAAGQPHFNLIVPCASLLDEIGKRSNAFALDTARTAIA
jgi:hypothetical protein